jgi:hypothetical protein
MKYRDHRSTLSESMGTIQEFNSIDELRNYLTKVFNWGIIDQIKIKHYCYDRRINWDTYLVRFNFVNDPEFKIAGMSDSTF